MAQERSDDREIDDRGRRALLGSLAAAAGAAVAKPAAALEQATRDTRHLNVLDHLDDII